MSLLADLLSKVKRQDQQSSVPPNLANIIQRSSQKKRAERKFVILLAAVLFFVVAGFGAVYFFESYLASPSKGIASRQGLALRDKVPPAPPVQPAAAQPLADRQTQQPAAPGPQPEVQPDAKIPPNAEAKAPPALAQRSKTETVPGPRASQPSKRSSEMMERLKAERDSLIYSARTHEQNKHYSQAITDYKKALEKDPRNYLIMNSLASILIKTGAYEESTRYARDALNYQKNYVPSLINLGIAYVESGNMTEGETYLTRARTIEPTNKAVLFNLGLLYERLPNYQESLSHFQRLSEMKDIRGFMGMARVLEKQGRRTEAEKVYRSMLTMEDADPQTRQFANERLLAISDR
ncbi:MAG TPA: tetratricopeptide repeat protein [Syntrophorhabdaceae bacterium]|nr:tetratricopeptide repeat protein [Syntrophorhabdaceae bacterium]HQM82829.1 tetratricopeptide repeat protein [Syntrophorhabdaceae bacterium]